MITTGQTLQNAATGETLVFRTTPADTNGELVVVEAFVEPNGAVPGPTSTLRSRSGRPTRPALPGARPSPRRWRLPRLAPRAGR